MKSDQRSAARIIVWRLAQIVGLVVLGGAVFNFVGFIEDARARLVMRQSAEENVLSSRVREAALQEELSKRAHDIQRIEQLLLTRETLGGFIDAVEREGVTRGVEVAIPEIAEEEAPASGDEPIQDISVELVANGPSKQLISFLFALDHLPYILTVPTWSLATQRVPVGSLDATDLPAVSPTESGQGQLRVTVLVALRPEEGTQKENEQ